jgi:hypothetical protein
MDDSLEFPGLKPVEGHLDVIDTEIVEMCLMGEGVTLRAGLGQGGIINRSPGAIAEDPADSMIGESFFDVFFEVDIGGGQLAYNQDPMRIEANMVLMVLLLVAGTHVIWKRRNLPA